VKTWQKIFASCCSVLVLTVAACDRAPVVTPVTLTVHNAWARPADSGSSTALYFILANSGHGADTLVGVASTEAEVTELHVSTQRGGMMHMSQVRTLPVPAEDSVTFRPLGAHVMMMRVLRRLTVADTVAATLTFSSGQQVVVRAGVRPN